MTALLYASLCSQKVGKVKITNITIQQQGSICHLLIVAYRPLLLYLRNPRAKPFMFGFYNQRFL